jgi:hypothetical protein
VDILTLGGGAVYRTVCGYSHTRRVGLCTGLSVGWKIYCRWTTKFSFVSNICDLPDFLACLFNVSKSYIVTTNSVYYKNT